MNKIDTTKISLIVAIIAIIAPMLTSLISGHQSKVSKVEDYKLKSLDKIKLLFEELLTAYGKAATDWNWENYTNLSTSTAKVLPYLPKKYLDKFLELLKQYDIDDYKSVAKFQDIIPDIQTIINTLTDDLLNHVTFREAMQDWSERTSLSNLGSRKE
ncbi:hypothetical protein [Lactococcus lactis]|uniref:hypothetical protein n=1 Tax=Lactococcus lactis TaxID=1358 RepID=UPI0010134366|nr:hypothetical protein [Lactococcus lactis]RXS51062.1 hypothetical protein ES032_08885 [Lactococcus lactis]